MSSTVVVPTDANRGCDVQMSDELRCGRPLHESAESHDPKPRCLMHSRDPRKDPDQFGSVIRAIRIGICPYHRCSDRFDFSHFVFPEAVFSRGSWGTRIADYIDIEDTQRFWERFHSHAKQLGERAEGAKQSSPETEAREDEPNQEASNSEPPIDNLDPNVDAAFSRDVDFTGAVFVGPAWFVDLAFKGTACFVGATFQSRAYFRQARFLKFADFERATFSDEVEFFNASFYTAVRFLQAQFAQSVRFSETVFNFDAYFSHTQFAGPTDFSAAAFNDGVVFKVATFGSKADFSSTLFRGKIADFTRTTFNSDVRFDLSLFSMAFMKRLPGAMDPISEPATGPVVADFTGATFTEPQLVHFRRVNQAFPRRTTSGARPDGFRVRFIDCDVRDIHLDDVNWYRNRKRMMLQDEITVSRRKLMPEERHELVSLAYQQLVSNFEDKGFYDLAEDCYIGSMEMKRLDPLRPLFVRVILTLYRGASMYGSDYSRAFAVLLGMIVAAGLLFALPSAGLAVTQLSNVHQSVSGWRRLPSGLFHAFEIASFQRDTLYSANTVFGRLMSMIAGIFIPSQLALFLLAVRRRFRR